jgi:hypothetical protein
MGRRHYDERMSAQMESKHRRSGNYSFTDITSPPRFADSTIA